MTVQMHKTALASVVTIIVIIAAVIAFILLTPTQPLEFELDIQLDIVDLTQHYENFSATITVTHLYNVSDINTSTLLLEGTLIPISWQIQDNQLILIFDGDAVINIILQKIYHLTPSVTTIELKVMGLIDSKEFEASDTIHVVGGENA